MKYSEIATEAQGYVSVRAAEKLLQELLAELERDGVEPPLLYLTMSGIGLQWWSSDSVLTEVQLRLTPGVPAQFACRSYSALLETSGVEDVVRFVREGLRQALSRETAIRAIADAIPATKCAKCGYAPCTGGQE